jgi:threonine dehydrogenase-like Zn-dependent dehydrogenase
MKATVVYGAGHVRAAEALDPTIQQPTDATVRIAACRMRARDLWPYKSLPALANGRRIGHELYGIVRRPTRR